MFSLFRALSDRLKALFAIDVANDLETQLITRDAERRAELLRLARRYQDEGLSSVAQQLRQRAETVDCQKPLSTVLPAIEHWRRSGPCDAIPPALAAPVKKNK